MQDKKTPFQLKEEFLVNNWSCPASKCPMKITI